MLRPKIATAAVMVAKISTMIRTRRTATAIPSWRFDFGSEYASRVVLPTEMLRLAAQAGVRALTESVDDLSALVIEAKEAPISVTAAVLSSSEDCGVSGASVASRSWINIKLLEICR